MLICQWAECFTSHGPEWERDIGQKLQEFEGIYLQTKDNSGGWRPQTPRQVSVWYKEINLVTFHTVKANGRSGSLAPPILNLDAKRTWLVKFTPLSRYPHPPSNQIALIHLDCVKFVQIVSVRTAQRTVPITQARRFMFSKEMTVLFWDW